MTDQARMRLTFLLIPIGFLFVLVSASLLVHHIHQKSSGYTTKLVDRDTGEVLYNQPNKAVEGNAGGGNLVIFGTQALFDGGATQEQFQLIQKALANYARTNLQNKYQTLTIIPSSFKSTVGSMAAQLRLGQSDNTVELTITISQLKYARVKVVDPGGQNGDGYDSGQLVVPTPTYRGTD